jgi:hypothetical protein
VLSFCSQDHNPSKQHSRFQVIRGSSFRLILALEHSPSGPKFYYQWHHDPNCDGTDQELGENRRILAELKGWLDSSRSSGPARKPPH